MGGGAVQVGPGECNKLLLVPRVRAKCLLREWEMNQDWGTDREEQAVRDHQQPPEALLRKLKEALQQHRQTQDEGKELLKAQQEEHQKLMNQAQEAHSNVTLG
ncbi:UNVERIFIED_CONTAM: hypothetical protein FKN15_013846 [Acipenser sinensis]